VVQTQDKASERSSNTDDSKPTNWDVSASSIAPQSTGGVHSYAVEAAVEKNGKRQENVEKDAQQKKKAVCE
jgi:hypothetical protein